MTVVVLHPGRDRSLRRRHPWVLAGAVARVDGADAGGPGALARVVSAEGEVLGYGDWSPASTLRVRMISFGKDAPPPDWLASRIAAAVARRRTSPTLRDTDAVRFVNAEGDDLPGLVVDRYADVLVVKRTSAGMLARGEAVTEALRDLAPSGFERADSAAARREGAAARQGPLWGDAPPPDVAIQERGRRYWVDVASGQKTGFYLDQRDARDLVQRLAAGRRVLDLFAYTGGFATAALAGGAREVWAVDSSAGALERLARNAPAAHRVREDAFRFVRREGERFDLVVVDPPPLARQRRDVARAARAYKDVLLHALQRTSEGGQLLAFACSHHVTPELFRKIAFGASLDARRPARVLGTLGQPEDHPVSLDHPEGAYLTGLWLQA